MITYQQKKLPKNQKRKPIALRRLVLPCVILTFVFRSREPFGSLWRLRTRRMQSRKHSCLTILHFKTSKSGNATKRFVAGTSSMLRRTKRMPRSLRQNSSINSTNHLISHSDFGALKRRFRDPLKRKIPCLVKAGELPGSAPDRLSGSFGFLDDLDFFETGNICFGNPDGRAMPDHRQERRSHFSFARRVSFA